MSEEIKDVVAPEVDDAVQAAGTPEVEEKPKKGSKGRKKGDDGDKAVVANLNEWEAAPVKSRAPKKVEEHPNGITAYHY